MYLEIQICKVLRFLALNFPKLLGILQRIWDPSAFSRQSTQPFLRQLLLIYRRNKNQDIQYQKKFQSLYSIFLFQSRLSISEKKAASFLPFASYCDLKKEQVMDVTLCFSMVIFWINLPGHKLIHL